MYTHFKLLKVPFSLKWDSSDQMILPINPVHVSPSPESKQNCNFRSGSFSFSCFNSLGM